MKKVILATALVLAATSASAANSLRPGAAALSFTVLGTQPDYQAAFVGEPTNVGMISGKYMMNNNLQLNAGFGMGIWGSDAEGTDLGFQVGARKFLRTDDLAPFFGGHFTFETMNDGNVTALEIAAEFGAEYFIGPKFSVDGAAMLGYASVDNDLAAGGAGATVSRIGTSSAAVNFNFYF